MKNRFVFFFFTILIFLKSFTIPDLATGKGRLTFRSLEILDIFCGFTILRFAHPPINSSMLFRDILAHPFNIGFAITRERHPSTSMDTLR